MDSILSFDKSSEPNYYCVLGCDRTSTSDQILREFKVKALELHPDKNNEDPKAECKFKLLMTAKEVLLDEKRRKLYDSWLDGGIAMPFEKWESMSKNVHVSLHWANRKQTNPMLEQSNDCGEGKSGGEKQFVWERDTSLTLNDFRNYRI
ncbi:hypothetical protein B4U79_05399 [Dinothrombium tinctorium]|uniref:J domain-containing protein n=1 Tax=Dinothrombium tinctorium TaxID=1965070 RepID=A0A443QL54_9ACAR|nr:hypothetical protein B4U79_05399 [Dinothrombium tinctorium]